MHPELKELLEETMDRCADVDRRENDPVGLVWPYKDAPDREVAALFASCLAYGRVDLLRPAIRKALAPLGDQPAQFLRQTSPAELQNLWAGFVYRMTRGPDLMDLAVAIRATLLTEESLEGLYFQPSAESGGSDPLQEHLARASAFVQALRRRRSRRKLHRGFRYLLPDPADGSTCKRLHLYFRWMVRGPDAVDFGIWKSLSPSTLIMPLDTHTSRLCRYLGLLERKSTDGKAALAVTRQLARFDASDPLRYDFALCHLGISGKCIHRRSPDHCPSCPIEPACILPSEK